MDLTDARRLVRVAQRDAELVTSITGPVESMLSPAELATLYLMVRMMAPKGARVAELGTYIGGTTRVLGEAFRRSDAAQPCVEVYDFFEHNDTSRRRLVDHPHYNERDFFDIWTHNTADYRDLIELHRGDLREVAPSAAPLWMVYVDIVKSGFLIDPVMRRFLPRLTVGEILVHQDYYHWQSPWVVYATERIIEHFDVLGTVSNHMLVLQLREPIPAAALTIDDEHLSWDDKQALMDRAIGRYPGLRSGLLRISKLNLMSVEGIDLPQPEIDAIREEFQASERLRRYLDAVIGEHRSNRARAVW